MKYLTWEWYNLLQKTFMHLGLKPCKEAVSFSEDLYNRLYKQEEKRFVEFEKEVYNVDIESVLLQEGAPMVELSKFIDGHSEEDIVPLVLTDEDKKRNQELIEAYKNRPPFDESEMQKRFAEIKDINSVVSQNTLNKLPAEIREKIADERVFVLGYATKEVITLLKQASKTNERQIKKIESAFAKEAKKQSIPEQIASDFNFHDCSIAQINLGTDIKIVFNTKGTFATKQNLIFKNAEVLEIHDNILGNIWLYNELYNCNIGYEVHVMFADGKYLTLKCSDIIIE